jgi:hypothetical protein
MDTSVLATSPNAHSAALPGRSPPGSPAARAGTRSSQRRPSSSHARVDADEDGDRSSRGEASDEDDRGNATAGPSSQRDQPEQEDEPDEDIPPAAHTMSIIVSRACAACSTGKGRTLSRLSTISISSDLSRVSTRRTPTSRSTTKSSRARSSSSSGANSCGRSRTRETVSHVHSEPAGNPASVLDIYLCLYAAFAYPCSHSPPPPPIVPNAALPAETVPTRSAS